MSYQPPVLTSQQVSQIQSTPARQRSKPWSQDNTLKGTFGFLVKEKIQCICEGGKSCSREDPSRQVGGNCIPGLHGSWVGDHIIAMARPWQENIVKFNLLDSFVRNKVGMVLNLQEVGEHASCGPGVLPHTGFSYDPESFMSARIGFYNFSWRDMGVPDLERMMDIVQVMEYVTKVEGRKIAVHCHAGLGRTGLAIACFFVFTGAMGADEAVVTVRKFRKGALQTSSQVKFVSIFEQYIRHLRCIYREPGTGTMVAGGMSVPAMPNGGGAAAAGGGGGGGGDANPLQAPPHIASGGPSLSSTSAGPVSSSTTANGAVSVSYPFGLTIIHPPPSTTSSSPTSSSHQQQQARAAARAAEVSISDLGLDKELPWNQHFHIQPSKFDPQWTPEPPSDYQESLRRQQRLLHGPNRRALVSLHQLPKECIFAIMAASNSIAASSPCSFAALASSLHHSTSQINHQQYSCIQPSSSYPPSAPPRGPPPPPPPPQILPAWVSFAHAFSSLISLPPPSPSSSPSLFDPRSIHDLSQACSGLSGGGVGGSLIGTAFLGTKPSTINPTLTLSSLSSSLSSLKAAVNQGSFALVHSSPLSVLIKALESFFMGFGANAEPSLSADGLLFIAQSYNKPPFSSTSYPPYPHSSHPHQDPHQQPHQPGGGDDVSRVSSAAQSLSPLPPPDQELLLLMASMIRHIARACGSKGAGCESELSRIVLWSTRLLLGPGPLGNHPAAQEAVASILWSLFRDDVTFAALLLSKKQRHERGRNYQQLQSPIIPTAVSSERMVSSYSHQGQQLQPSGIIPTAVSSERMVSSYSHQGQNAHESVSRVSAISPMDSGALLAVESSAAHSLHKAPATSPWQQSQPLHPPPDSALSPTPSLGYATQAPSPTFPAYANARELGMDGLINITRKSRKLPTLATNPVLGQQPPGLSTMASGAGLVVRQSRQRMRNEDFDAAAASSLSVPLRESQSSNHMTPPHYHPQPPPSPNGLNTPPLYPNGSSSHMHPNQFYPNEVAMSLRGQMASGEIITATRERQQAQQQQIHTAFV